MTSTTKTASVAIGALLVFGGSIGTSTGARAAIPTVYSLQPGTVLTTHTPRTNDCPISVWRLRIEPGDIVRGSIEELTSDKAWRVSGTYDSHGTFHLSGREVDGTERTATVDAQVQSDGSMIFRMANIGDPSQCYNRTVYLPWFRNGTDSGPPPPGGGGSGG